MKIGLLQLNPTIGDFTANTAKVIMAYHDACAQGAELVVTPELCLCGYPPRDLLLRQDFVESNRVALREVAAAVGTVPLCVGYVEKNTDRPGKALRNAAAWIEQGEVRQRIFKSLLPTYDVFDEDRYFEPSPAVAPVVFRGRKIGVTICEDIWNDEDFWPERIYRRDPVRELMAQGVDFLVNLSASPWYPGKEKTRIAMLQRVAMDEGVPLVQVNLCGANDELIFDGHSVVLDRNGGVLHGAPGFVEQVIVVEVDALADAPEPVWPCWQEMVYDALALGVRDYVAKCGFKTVVLGLSGGIDSALVAVLAVEALGPDHVVGVALPSRYSSPGSVEDAGALAENLGIRCEVISIENGFQALERQLEDVFAGRAPDLTEENMQSRLRGLTLMALSNKFGSLVLTTGNKSEMAVGYCTLYGDMCGALAVIADLWKTEVYEVARWVNRHTEIIPVSSLTKAPSAELRPDQTDQDSLPPYEMLDAILRKHIVENLGREELASQGFAAEIVNDVINKVTFSEYKRRQAAPGLKISPRAFGMGRRIPVAQRFRT